MVYKERFNCGPETNTLAFILSRHREHKTHSLFLVAKTRKLGKAEALRSTVLGRTLKVSTEGFGLSGSALIVVLETVADLTECDQVPPGRYATNPLIAFPGCDE